MAASLCNKSGSGSETHQSTLQQVVVTDINHVAMTDSVMEQVDRAMVQIVDGAVEQINSGNTLPVVQIVSGGLSQMVNQEIEPVVGEVIDQISNGLPSTIVKEEIHIDEVCISSCLLLEGIILFSYFQAPTFGYGLHRISVDNI